MGIRQVGAALLLLSIAFPSAGQSPPYQAERDENVSDRFGIKTANKQSLGQPLPDADGYMPAIPRLEQYWLRADDFPGRLTRNQGFAFTYRLLVDYRAQVKDCSITQSSGSVELDGLACRLLLHRARFAPPQYGPGRRPYYAHVGTFRLVKP